jgi:hypothetical protein
MGFGAVSEVVLRERSTATATRRVRTARAASKAARGLMCIRGVLSVCADGALQNPQRWLVLSRWCCCEGCEVTVSPVGARKKR